jgi:hypothetical protein
MLLNSDYQSALERADCGIGRNRFLKQLLLAAKADRTPSHQRDIATHLSVFDLFRNMDPEFREEISGIVEYLSVPQGE